MFILSFIKEVSCFNIYIPYHTNLCLWQVSWLLVICLTHCNLHYSTILTMLGELYKTVISLSYNNLNFPLIASHLSLNGFLNTGVWNKFFAQSKRSCPTHTTDTLILCSWILHFLQFYTLFYRPSQMPISTMFFTLYPNFRWSPLEHKTGVYCTCVCVIWSRTSCKLNWLN